MLDGPGLPNAPAGELIVLVASLFAERERDRALALNFRDESKSISAWLVWRRGGGGGEGRQEAVP